jgi:hypothetical protein
METEPSKTLGLAFEIPRLSILPLHALAVSDYRFVVDSVLEHALTLVFAASLFVELILWCA